MSPARARIKPKGIKEQLQAAWKRHQLDLATIARLDTNIRTLETANEMLMKELKELKFITTQSPA